jgi:hypothetical protein
MGKNLRCIWRFGTWFEGLLNVISLGHSKQIAGFIAIKVFGLTDCGCDRRKSKWDAFFGCDDRIKL